MRADHEESPGGGIILALVYGLPAFVSGLLFGLVF